MPIPVQCPNPACGATAPVADALNGRSVRCKRCGTPFRARPSLDGAPARNPRAAAPAPVFPTLPAAFGRYKVLRLLGQGGMGAVYLADDSQLGRTVALKIPTFGGADVPARVERFVREARAAAALHHPNICTIFDAGEIGGTPFLTMAYIAGTPLDREIDPDTPMAQRRAAGIARKVALALAQAHAKGIVHRDLKPANVVMAADDEPVVMDFGLAKRATEHEPVIARGAVSQDVRLTRTDGLLGTPGYMSPEQVKGDPAAVGPASDVYSLGVILFEMLTGKPPYSGPVRVVLGQVLAAPVPAVREFRPDADPRLAAVCQRAMAKDPAARFRSMAEFADALRVYLAAPTAGTMTARLSVSPDSPRPEVAPSTGRRPRWPYPAALAGVAALTIAGLWAGGVFKGKPPVVVASEPVPVVVPHTESPESVAKPDPTARFAPEKSEWAGLGFFRDNQGEHRVAGAWTFIERSGPTFKALWRSGGGQKARFEGTIDENGQLTFTARERLEPQAMPREDFKGTGEVTSRRMVVSLEDPSTGATATVDFKYLPDGGNSFDFQGRWLCTHRPNKWNSIRTITGNTHTTDWPAGPGTWERDGGLIMLYFPRNGKEWVVIDPDNPNELNGTNGTQFATWVRQ